MTQISAYDAGRFIKDVLQEVFSDHVSRGTDGQLVRDVLNQFGERSLVGDYMAEHVAIAKIRTLAERYGVTILVVAEEHGYVTIGTALIPDYTIYLDGLDGSSVYAGATPAQLRFRTTRTPFSRRPRYGTMIAICQGANPRYCDVLAAGILEPTTNRTLIATKGGGIALSHPYQVGRGRAVRTSGKWDPAGLIYCDKASPCNRAVFEYPLEKMYGLDTVSAGSAARYYLDVATGAALASCEWTRKLCLEVVTGYLLVTEAGGIVTNLAGLDIGRNRINLWGSHFTEFFIAAGSEDIVAYILEAVVNATPSGYY